VTEPRLLICDEPVSALDASSRNHVLRLLDHIRRELNLPIIVISHDQSSLAGVADRAVVLYRGRIVEDGPIDQVFRRPRHPYTALLLASAPSVIHEKPLVAQQLRRTTGTPRRREQAGPSACSPLDARSPKTPAQSSHNSPTSKTTGR